MKQFFFTPLLLLLCCILITGFMSACNPTRRIDKNFLYFQRGRDSSEVFKVKERVIKPNDQLNIQILSKTLNQEQAGIFNMSSSIPGTSGTSGGSYLVGINGNIEIPIIGSIKAEGLTKVQLQTLLTSRLTPYIKEPSVTIRFLLFTVNVLGEVKAAGIKIFNTDQVTLFDALSASGDLTDLAKREDVTVIREENGKMKYTKVDLRSGTVFNSPVYQLQPYDIIYVGANTKKLIVNNINPTSGKTISTISVILSITITVISLIFTFTRH